MIAALLIMIVYRRQWQITQVDGLLTPDDCQYIINSANFAPSTTLDGNKAYRTSETAWIPKTDAVAQKVLLKACELSGTSLEQCEDLQVVRYNPGTYYKPHQDSCCDKNTYCDEFKKERGERLGTLLVYLNNDFTDGETEFPNIKQKFKPSPGSGIFWDPYGCPPEALHAGLPVSSGTKYVCNSWIREK